jgi:hypothetical protein
MFPKEHQNGINASASDPPKAAKADSFVRSLDALRHKAFRPQNPLAKTLFADFFPDPSQMGLAFLALLGFNRGGVPPSGGSLEIGNVVTRLAVESQSIQAYALFPLRGDP